MIDGVYMQDKKTTKSLVWYMLLVSIVLFFYIVNYIRTIRSDSVWWLLWPWYKQLYTYDQQQVLHTWPLISWSSHWYVRQCQDQWFLSCPLGVLWYWNAWLGWIQAIQYAAWYVTPSNPHNLLTKIYNASPYQPDWAAPYILGATLGPAMTAMTWEARAKDSRTNTLLLGDEWLAHTCDTKKIAYIQTLSYTWWLSAYYRRDPRMMNPCTDYTLASILWFVSMNHLQDSTKAYMYYLIAASHTGTPSITQSMPALVYQQVWNHYMSFSMRYDQFMQPIPDLDSRRIKYIQKCMEQLSKFVMV